ncbi:hypothetical protein [Bacillus thuringiensis]|nr:hypothetical protein [Bacillus thuringiensis]
MNSTYIIREIYLTKKMNDMSLSEKERKIAKMELTALQGYMKKTEAK